MSTSETKNLVIIVNNNIIVDRENRTNLLHRL